MSDPSYLLQDAIVKRLKADAGMQDLIAQRVYDEVPPAATAPYVNVGEGQVVGDDDDCADVSEATFQIHAWSKPPDTGFGKVKKIAGAVRAAMKAPFAIAGFDLLLQEFRQAQWLDDPDGRTRHAVIEYRFIIVHS